MTTPAQRYAASRRRSPAFEGLYDFEFDDFQRRACQGLKDGTSVLVAAPTGSGKTVIGEFAVHLALAGGRKCFYTTPIKALSNQKYADLVRRYGPDKVGLLTGDNSVNGEAPVVVMTTEVLRNMLYAGSATLSGLGYVVLDEVHYLADRFRGAVWEEGIIHLPESVEVVAPAAPVRRAAAAGGDRAAGPGRPVAGDHVHLQPGRLRRRGGAVRGRRAAADHAGRGGRDHRAGRAADRGHPGRGPARARVRRVADRPAARHRRAPRRAAAHVQGSRRRAVRGRPDPRGVRHRDA